MNRAQRRANLKGRPDAMKLVEAQVNSQTAEQLHARLVAAGVARVPEQDAADLYFVMLAYRRIAELRRLPGGPDQALAEVEAEVRELTGLPMPVYR